LPAVLPIVLYNGDDRWQITTNPDERDKCLSQIIFL